MAQEYGCKGFILTLRIIKLIFYISPINLFFTIHVLGEGKTAPCMSVSEQPTVCRCTEMLWNNQGSTLAVFDDLVSVPPSMIVKELVSAEFDKSGIFIVDMLRK